MALNKFGPTKTELEEIELYPEGERTENLVENTALWISDLLLDDPDLEPADDNDLYANWLYDDEVESIWSFDDNEWQPVPIKI